MSSSSPARSTATPSTSAPSGRPTVERATVLIIGAGFSGLGAAVQLRKQGVRDILILERASEVGGTWRDNVYPGCACDVPSHLYSFSFQLNPDWRHHYARQDEIHDYLKAVRRDHGLDPLLRLKANVVRSEFDESAGEWTVHTADGRRFVGRFLVAGLGPLRTPRIPDVPGKARFRGDTMHSAEWRDSVELTGKRVGVVGSGASAIQVVPNIAEDADHVHVFQRSPPWVAPRFDRAYPDWLRGAFRTVPALMWGLRALIYLRQELYYFTAFSGPEWLRRSIRKAFTDHILWEMDCREAAEPLIPDYAPGCKRILSSSDWYPALRRHDVTLHPNGVAEVTETGVVLGNGEQVELDVLVWCTGYLVDQMLGHIEVVGPDGRDLRTVWGHRPQAHLGIGVPGFPNLFLLLGPNTGLGHNSVVIMIEAQLRYISRAIRHTLGRGPRAHVAPTQAALDAYVSELDAKHSALVWQSGCASWYLNEAGENFSLWPGSTLSYMLRTLRFDAENQTFGGLAP